MTISPSRTAFVPVPAVPRPDHTDASGGPVSFTVGHHCSLVADADVAALAEAAATPLSVIVQVTSAATSTAGSVRRRCRLTPRWGNQGSGKVGWRFMPVCRGRLESAGLVAQVVVMLVAAGVRQDGDGQTTGCARHRP
jgi:hypothetical protein